MAAFRNATTPRIRTDGNRFGADKKRPALHLGYGAPDERGEVLSAG